MFVAVRAAQAMDKKEYFKLRLQGWWYKGTINDWYYDDNPAWTMAGFPIKGNATRLYGSEEVCIPAELIEKKERIDGVVTIFLTDSSVYRLGKQRDE